MKNIAHLIAMNIVAMAQTAKAIPRAGCIGLIA
jgi:hypothetical protein